MKGIPAEHQTAVFSPACFLALFLFIMILYFINTKKSFFKLLQFHKTANEQPRHRGCVLSVVHLSLYKDSATEVNVSF